MLYCRCTTSWFRLWAIGIATLPTGPGDPGSIPGSLTVFWSGSYYKHVVGMKMHACPHCKPCAHTHSCFFFFTRAHAKVCPAPRASSFAHRTITCIACAPHACAQDHTHCLRATRFACAPRALRTGPHALLALLFCAQGRPHALLARHALCLRATRFFCAQTGACMRICACAPHACSETGACMHA